MPYREEAFAAAREAYGKAMQQGQDGLAAQLRALLRPGRGGGRVIVGFAWAVMVGFVWAGRSRHSYLDLLSLAFLGKTKAATVSVFFVSEDQVRKSVKGGPVTSPGVAKGIEKVRKMSGGCFLLFR